MDSREHYNQAALYQKAEEEIAKLELPKESLTCSKECSPKANLTKHIYEKPLIRAIGYISGKIVHLGTKYTSFVGSFRAQQDWLNCWEDYYHKPVDFETLRQLNESFTTDVVSYEDKDLARIREIRNPNIVGWRIAGGSRPQTSDSRLSIEYNKMWDENDSEQANELRLFLGTDYLIGLVPSAAKIGDFIIKFWNYNAAIVMRPVNPRFEIVSAGEGPKSSFMLVCRADVAELSGRMASPGFDFRAEGRFLGNTTPHLTESFETTGAVYVDMDFPTLQMITASIIT
jgi:hypothetical protein